MTCPWCRSFAAVPSFERIMRSCPDVVDVPLPAPTFALQASLAFPELDKSEAFNVMILGRVIEVRQQLLAWRHPAA